MDGLTPPLWPELPKSRLASRFLMEESRDTAIALLGMPDDTGVGLNNGRLGAAEGPAAIRAALASYGAAEAAGIRWPNVYDAGDIRPGSSLEETHERVSDAAAELSRKGMVVLGLGGGHDLTFPLVRGVSRVHGPMHGVYFDAHLDVRAERGSGMPFRALVENGIASRLTAHGLDPFANSSEHTSWFRGHRGHLGDDVSPADPWAEAPTFVSLDMDVLDQAHAPGVSARNPCGWSPEQAARWVFAAGKNRTTRCFDIMELSPPHDESGRTARLAAHLLLRFLHGFSLRGRA